jgi:hypothetical protein
LISQYIFFTYAFRSWKQNFLYIEFRNLYWKYKTN